MTNNFKGYFNNLHLNKFYANCLKISSSNNTVEFDEPFLNNPEVFVTVNRFLITYGNEGSLEKKDIGFDVTKDNIVFKVSEGEEGSDLPICFLAIEKES